MITEKRAADLVVGDEIREEYGDENFYAVISMVTRGDDVLIAIDAPNGPRDIPVLDRDEVVEVQK